MGKRWRGWRWRCRRRTALRNRWRGLSLRQIRNCEGAHKCQSARHRHSVTQDRPSVDLMTCHRKLPAVSPCNGPSKIVQPQSDQRPPSGAGSWLMRDCGRFSTPTTPSCDILALHDFRQHEDAGPACLPQRKSRPTAWWFQAAARQLLHRLDKCALRAIWPVGYTRRRRGLQAADGRVA